MISKVAEPVVLSKCSLNQTPEQGQLRGRAVAKAPHSAATTLKSLTIFEQRTLHFHFALGPINYAVGPAPEPEVWFVLGGTPLAQPHSKCLK